MSMKNAVIIILLAALVGVLIHEDSTAVTFSISTIATSSVPALNTPFPIDTYPKWNCHLLVTCPWEDWRYTKAQDVCTYEDKVVYSPINPAEGDGEPGDYCYISS